MNAAKTKRRWTAADESLMMAEYRLDAGRTVARKLGRPLRQVQRRATLMGLATLTRRHRPRPELDEDIRRLNAEGLPDAEIARRLKCDRHTVSYRRRAMVLPCHQYGEWKRAQTKAITDAQCAAAGVNNFGEYRAKTYRDFAAARGWPSDLRPRAVQILDVLYEFGPQTRQQICEAIGMRWKGTRASLTSNDPEGSYLAHLAGRGLVTRLKRAVAVTGRGRGRSVDLYAIPAGIKRGEPDTWPSQTIER